MKTLARQLAFAALLIVGMSAFAGSVRADGANVTCTWNGCNNYGDSINWTFSYDFTEHIGTGFYFDDDNCTMDFVLDSWQDASGVWWYTTDADRTISNLTHDDDTAHLSKSGTRACDIQWAVGECLYGNSNAFGWKAAHYHYEVLGIVDYYSAWVAGQWQVSATSASCTYTRF